MKSISMLIAAPLLSLSSMVFAEEPLLLSAAEMDGVTAGTYWTEIYKFAVISQINVSPVTVVQVSAGNISLGSGGTGSNTAFITSGNFAEIRQ